MNTGDFSPINDLLADVHASLEARADSVLPADFAASIVAASRQPAPLAEQPELLNAFYDGELPTAQAFALQQAIEQDEAARGRIKQLSTVSNAIVANTGALEENCPDDMWQRVISQVVPAKPEGHRGVVIHMSRRVKRLSLEALPVAAAAFLLVALSIFPLGGRSLQTTAAEIPTAEEYLLSSIGNGHGELLAEDVVAGATDVLLATHEVEVNAAADTAVGLAAPEPVGAIK